MEMRGDDMGKALRPVSVAGIEFDALIDESRSFSADAPEYPTEKGFVVSDSIVLKPQTLDMTLYVTDLPVTWKKWIGGGNGRVQDVVKRLEDVYFSKQPVTVITSENTYNNMVITSITIAKSLESGYAREIPISLKEIRVTKSETTTIPASYGKSGKSGTNAGTAGTKSSSSGGSINSAGAASNRASSSGSSSSSTSGSSSSGAKQQSGSILYNIASSSGLL